MINQTEFRECSTTIIKESHTVEFSADSRVIVMPSLLRKIIVPNSGHALYALHNGMEQPLPDEPFVTTAKPSAAFIDIHKEVTACIVTVSPFVLQCAIDTEEGCFAPLCDYLREADHTILKAMASPSINCEEKSEVIRRYFDTLLAWEDGEDSAYRKFIHNICMNLDKVTIPELAEFIALNRKKFNKLIKDAISMTPYQFVQAARIQKACETILDERRPHIDFHALGFYDQPHFIKTFKKFTTMTPSQLISEAEAGALICV